MKGINCEVVFHEPVRPSAGLEDMRDYALDLQARWPAAASGKSDLLLELLAFAEGRFLTVHPFRDFNGRTIRVIRRSVVSIPGFGRMCPPRAVPSNL